VSSYINYSFSATYNKLLQNKKLLFPQKEKKIDKKTQQFPEKNASCTPFTGHKISSKSIFVATKLQSVRQDTLFLLVKKPRNNKVRGIFKTPAIITLVSLG